MTEQAATSPGHNRPDSERLKMYVERIERLEEEKAAISDDIGEVYTEAKDSGFDPKIMRAIIKERKLDEQERKEREELLDLYRGALGMLDGTPLGDAALAATGAMT